LETPPEAHIKIRAGGERIATDGELIQDGQRFSLKIPPEAKRVDVLVEAAGRRATWFLDLGPERAASRDVIREVNKAITPLMGLIENRRFTEVRTTLDRFSLPPKAPAESRYYEEFYRGLLAREEGDYRLALAAVQRAVEIAERVLWDGYREWTAKQTLALLLGKLGRFREAAELFESLGPTPKIATPCEKAQLLNNQAWSALLACEAGESFADPTSLLERSLATYKTCDRFTGDKEFNLLINLALAHLQGRRVQQAKDVLAQAHNLAPAAPLYQKLWWLDLEARIALQDGQREEALRGFQRLEELALATSSPDGRLRAAFGQARSHQDLGDLTAALEALQKAEALLDEQSLQIPLYAGRETFMATRQAVVSLHVDTLLRQGRNAEALDVARHARSRMLRQLERSDRLANLTPDQRARWDGLLAKYQEKRAVLEERAKDDWKLPLDQLSREQAARKAETEAVKELLDQAFLVLGDPPREAPPRPPSPGELILAYHPLPDGWVGFAADGKTVAVHRFELPPGVLSRPEELAERLLVPFRTSIEKAKKIRILASGPLQSVDFHELPFAMDVLLAKCPVAYGLDLPAPPGQPHERHALLVADPQGDLPGTLVEARMVQDALQHQVRPWITEELKAEQASPQAVRDRLAAADLLHYAGHGIFSGFGGWESSLPLAGETELTLGDLLALERVPAWVVLSGCETGRSSAETPVESLGLAYAFLLAGSQAVIASTRRADDRTVPAFFAELYRHWDGEQDLAVALQHAQLSWQRRNSKADWAGFRIFEP
jgi:tetratricopeptide (TPR) repeat protein